MKLRFKQRMFSWFDSYDVYYEDGRVAFTVKGQLSWGHCLKIYGEHGEELGTVKEKVFSFLPRFEMYLGEDYVGCIKKEFTFFKPSFTLDCNGWKVDGNLFEWDYSVREQNGYNIATVSKELFNWTDTYTIDVASPQHALCVLMIVLAIDAEKCSRD